MHAQSRPSFPAHTPDFLNQTESRPQFKAGRQSHPVALVQLYADGAAYLFRVCRVLVPELLDLLRDPTVMKAGVGVSGDRDAIARISSGFNDNGSFMDLRPFIKAKFPLVRRQGLRNIVATLFRQRMTKQQQLSNWENRRLTAAQEAYAANDAYVAIPLLQRLLGLP